MVTTTHDPLHGGNPRLLLSPGNHSMPAGSEQVEFPLAGDVTAVGGEHEDVSLPGCSEVLGRVLHDGADEYVYEHANASVPCMHAGAPVSRCVLRTGDRLELGPWTLSFFREEHADHGRPYGGRQGGEGSHQTPQPPRESMSAAAPSSPPERPA